MILAQLDPGARSTEYRFSLFRIETIGETPYIELAFFERQGENLSRSPEDPISNQKPSDR